MGKKDDETKKETAEAAAAVADKPKLDPEKEYEVWLGLLGGLHRQTIDCCGVTFHYETEKVKNVKHKMKSIRVPQLGLVVKLTGARILQCVERLAQRAMERVGNRDVTRTAEETPVVVKRGGRTLSEVCYMVPAEANLRRDETPKPLSVTGLPVFK